MQETGLVKKKFNVSGDCKPELHYMVDLKSRVQSIKEMVDRGDYFMINRARQYGKTTILRALGRCLRQEYMVVSLDFQRMGASKFKDENVFSLAFAKMFIKSFEHDYIGENRAASPAAEALRRAVEVRKDELELFELFEYLSNICKECKASHKPVVLMIDEADQTADNQVFLDFLSQLRSYYLDRDVTATFQSVILAGVYDVKNIKQKIRPDREHRFNSPWNIAVDFLVDMSFSAAEIKGMLSVYDADYKTGMDTETIADMIYAYTSGYPFLVSRVCKLTDERVAGSDGYPGRRAAWTKDGILQSVKLLLAEKNTLFESLIHKVEEYPELRKMLHSLLFVGNRIPYNPLNKTIEVAEMFGFVKEEDGNAVISNRIFETVLYNLFLSEEVLASDLYKVAQQEKNQFVHDGCLDMELVLKKFVLHFNDLYGDQEERFLEDAGRRYFLLYLKPIINGVGNYYIEAQTRDMERTDVIVDYRGEQMVVELKIWRGNAYHERGEKQLMEYLEHYHLKKGYMVSFNFNKKKEIGVKEIRLGDKVLVEAVV